MDNEIHKILSRHIGKNAASMVGEYIMQRMYAVVETSLHRSLNKESSTFYEDDSYGDDYLVYDTMMKTRVRATFVSSEAAYKYALQHQFMAFNGDSSSNPCHYEHFDYKRFKTWKSMYKALKRETLVNWFSLLPQFFVHEFVQGAHKEPPSPPTFDSERAVCESTRKSVDEELPEWVIYNHKALWNA